MASVGDVAKAVGGLLLDGVLSLLDEDEEEEERREWMEWEEKQKKEREEREQLKRELLEEVSEEDLEDDPRYPDSKVGDIPLHFNAPPSENDEGE